MTTIKPSKSIKILGLIIDSSLEWTEHIQSLTKKCNSVLWSLYPIQKLLTVNNRKEIANAYILSKISYMSIIWGSAGKKYITAVESILRRVSRFVLGLRKYDSVKTIITADLKWLLPEYLYKFEILKMAHSILYDKCPPYFYNYLNTDNINSITTRRNKYQFTKYIPVTKQGTRSFSHQGSQQWISLPSYLKSIDNSITFKKHLKEFILAEQAASCYVYDIDISDYDMIIERVVKTTD